MLSKYLRSDYLCLHQCGLWVELKVLLHRRCIQEQKIKKIKLEPTSVYVQDRLPFLGGVFVDGVKNFVTVLTLLDFSFVFLSSNLLKGVIAGCDCALWCLLAYASSSSLCSLGRWRQNNWKACEMNTSTKATFSWGKWTGLPTLWRLYFLQKRHSANANLSARAQSSWICLCFSRWFSSRQHFEHRPCQAVLP